MRALRRETVHGVELAVADCGQGHTLMLVHGFPLDHTIWSAQLGALAARCRVIAPDLRGFGQSGVTRGTVTMEQLADDLAVLAEALAVEVPLVLCGLSMGGYVAFQFWRKYSERVAGLILCDTRAEADDPSAAAARRETAERVLAEGPAGLVETMLPKLLAPVSLRSRPELVEAVRQMILRTPPEGIAAAQRGMAVRPDCTGLLGQITCPTLVVVGQHDTITPPEQMQRMAQAMPHARVVVIPEAGHLAPLENADAVTQAIATFLEENLRGSGSATGS